MGTTHTQKWHRMERRKEEFKKLEKEAKITRKKNIIWRHSNSILVVILFTFCVFVCEEVATKKCYCLHFIPRKPEKISETEVLAFSDTNHTHEHFPVSCQTNKFNLTSFFALWLADAWKPKLNHTMPPRVPFENIYQTNFAFFHEFIYNSFSFCYLSRTALYIGRKVNS